MSRQIKKWLTGIHRWFGPNIHAVRRHLNLTEISSAAMAAVGALAAVQVLLQSLPKGFVPPHWYDELTVLATFAAGIAEAARRLNQGADIKVTTPAGTSQVEVLPPPTQTLVVTTPIEQQFMEHATHSEEVTLVVPASPDQPTIVVPAAHPQEQLQ